MNIRFIIGRAGSGKTHTCLNEIKNTLKESAEGKPLIFIVPEQATFQIEYALTTTPGLDGLMRAQVLSFRRLAWRVLTETGGAARIPIGELGKRMVLRRCIESNRNQLKVFSSSTQRPGLADKLASSIGEMKIYNNRPTELLAALEVIGSNNILLKDKLSDLTLLYKELEEYMANRYTDPDDYLTLLADKIVDSPTIKGANIWIDGFTGFTPQEFAVIKSIIRYAETVNIALCMDTTAISTNLDESDLFYPTWETYRELIHISGQLGATSIKEVLLTNQVPHRFSKSPAIAHLEKYFHHYPTVTFKGSPTEIKLVGGANRRAEVEAVAREVIKLCRDNEYRWRDISVLMRDIDAYSELISTVFHDHDIPFFIDHKRNIMHHPLIELIRSSIETQYRDWAYEPVFRFLKTDFAPISREQVDTLENYVLAHGIRGNRWIDQSDWSYRLKYTLDEEEEIKDEEIKSLTQLNHNRVIAIEALKTFVTKLKNYCKVSEYCRAIFELIENLDVAEKLTVWAKSEESSGNLERSKEHIQIWNMVISLLDELVETMGEDELSPETFLAVLDSGFENMRLGLIPPGLDQVLVGNLDRSRNPDLKAVFLLGASEGIIPSRATEDGIFNDQERSSLNQLGINLAPGSRRRTFDEQFLIYLALTRASEFLWISYPLADDEGKAIAPSSVVSRLAEIVPTIQNLSYMVEPTWGNDNDLEFVTVPRRSLNYLTGSLRDAKIGRSIHSIWLDVYNWFINNNHYKYLADKTIKGVFHQNTEDPIDVKLSRRLYKTPIRASVSRIERYKSCPFAHFSNYGLRLKERPLYKLAAPDMGEFFHAALKNFVEHLNKEHLDWSNISSDDCTLITGNIVDLLAPKLQSEILLSTARYRYLIGKLKKIVRRATLVLSEHARRSSFRPIGVELSFGPGAELPPVIINLSGEDILQLAGRIDRVDMAQIDGQSYLRVIDYKSGYSSIDLSDIYHGLKLQLLTYLHVVLTHSDKLNFPNSLPGGVLYFTVKDPMIKSAYPISREDINKNILKQLKTNGYLLADTDMVRLMDNHLTTGWSELLPVAIDKSANFYAKSKVFSNQQFSNLRSYLENIFMEAGQEIISGRISIDPYRKGNNTSCQFCSYKPVCQFDLLLEENKYRYISPMPTEKFWNLIADKGGKS